MRLPWLKKEGYQKKTRGTEVAIRTLNLDLMGLNLQGVPYTRFVKEESVKEES